VLVPQKRIRCWWSVHLASLVVVDLFIVALFVVVAFVVPIHVLVGLSVLSGLDIGLAQEELDQFRDVELIVFLTAFCALEFA
jgi:hypothetical protein